MGVGIGTTTPSTNLDVVASGVPQIRIIDTDAPGSGIVIGDAGSGASLFWPMFRSFPIGTNRYAWFISELKTGEDTGPHPAMVFASRYNGANDLTTRPLFEWRNNSTPYMTMSVSGNVGIGTTSPVAKLQVAGVIISTPAVIAAATVDLATSNTHTLDTVGGSTITLQNMLHGGGYTLVVTDTNTRTYTFSGCNTSKFKPANAPTTAGAATIYSILTVYNGSTYDCYITWASGYQ